jgi:uncharacterized protein YdaU (DUF1376 family)
MSKPWMPWYIADFLGDTQHLDAAETGGYLLLLGHYWLNGGALPDHDAALARVARMTPAQWKRSRETLLRFFPEGKNKRADVEIAHAAEVSRKRSASAKQKHSNSSANAPANAEQMDTHARASPQPQPQEDSSLRSEARKRATRLAEGWMPNEDDGRYAVEKGLTQAEAQHEFEKFRNYWMAKSGSTATKIDWSLTWRNWILTTMERKGRPNGNGSNRGRQSLGDLAGDLAEEARQLELAAGVVRPNAPVGSA